MMGHCTCNLNDCNLIGVYKGVYRRIHSCTVSVFKLGRSPWESLNLEHQNKDGEGGAPLGGHGYLYRSPPLSVGATRPTAGG